MSTNYHTPIPPAPAQPEATSELFNNRFSELDAGIGTKLASDGDGGNVTAAFTQAANRTNIGTGEKLSTLFGKIKKWFAELKPIAFSGHWNDIEGKPDVSTPAPHAASHAADGADQITISKSQISDFPTTFPVANHASNHAANSTDPIAPESIGALSPTSDASNVTTSFQLADSIEDLVSGEKLSFSLGKLKKWFSALVSSRLRAGENIALTTDIEGNVTITSTGGGTGSGDGGHIISGSGIALPSRGVLAFSEGTTAVDNESGGRTDVKLDYSNLPEVLALSDQQVAAVLDGNEHKKTTLSEFKKFALGTPETGHHHDGVTSRKISYHDLLNIPSAEELPNHAARHSALGMDPLSISKTQIVDLPGIVPSNHIHDGSDSQPISYLDLTNRPTDMHPASHAVNHAADGSDAIIIRKSQISDFPTEISPVAHKSSHATGGTDMLTPADIGAMAAAPSAITPDGGTLTIAGGLTVTGLVTGNFPAGAATKTTGILTVAGWQNGMIQEVVIAGITPATPVIIVGATPESFITYSAAKIYCDAQLQGKLRFRCTGATPTVPISVQAVWF